jgi:hypothetical protein
MSRSALKSIGVNIRRLAPLVALAFGWAAEAGALSIAPPDERGWPRLSLESNSKKVVLLETSNDLEAWREIGRSHGRFFAFPDPSAGTLPLPRFYRGLAVPRLDTDDWKNQVQFPDDPMRSPEPGYGRDDPRWIKFAIDLDEPYRVYFQDSTRYPFHYDFAVARLDPFREMSRTEFDAVSLRRANQRVLLGAVLFASSANLDELAVQIVGLDPYPVEQVADWIDLVRATIIMPPAATLFYFPTYEQAPLAEANLGFFQSRGIQVSSVSRWAWIDESYSTGWALGRLVFVPAAELNDYYRDGLLRPEDILLIDAVPASVPPVAGIITLTPATPNAHAVILAKSFGIPFVYFADESIRGQLRSWDGREVILRANSDFWGVHVKAVNVQGQLDPELRDALLELKALPELDIPPITPAGTISLPTDNLWPADIRFVGGKAAHFGLLRRAIPDHSPTPALAFTFDLWVDYLSQPLPSGETLREAIGSKLAGFSWPPNMTQLQSALAEIRELIRNGTNFSPVARQEILTALIDAGFTTTRRIRFRSSTNVEDSEQFSGAGLYDSYSGCLGDDLADGDGPSFCNPTEPQKRGVLRALRRVYASFYNDNAFLERLRHGVDESEVGMAVLVHYSFPDEIELANGVATLRISSAGNPEQRAIEAQLVTQLGAVSITNPEGNAVPEVIRASSWASGAAWLEVNRHSSLVPLGDHVLVWEQDYRDLFRLLDLSAKAYEAAFPGKTQIALDFEYKKVAPRGLLSVDQIREIPQPPDSGSSIPWLLNETNRYALQQGELGELFAYHRLKSSWSFQTANLRLDPDNLALSFHRQFSADLLLGRTPTNIIGDLRALPDFQHHREGDTSIERWTWGEGEDSRQFELRTWLPTEIPSGNSPLIFLGDGRIELVVAYPTPRPAWTHLGPGTTRTDHVTLMPVDPVGPLSLRQSRRLNQGNLEVETSFYWPSEPRGPSAGYTAPLQGWVQTTITGLISRPIVLRGDYSQSYQPGHHNFWETFLFDPHLEPGLDPELLEELTARNIRGLVAGYYGPDQPVDFWIWGLDDTLR